MHEAVLEYGFHHHRAAFRDAVERHELRLHVGGECRVRRGTHVHRFRAPRHFQMDGVTSNLDLCAGFGELFQHSLQNVGTRLAQGDATASRCRRHQKGSALDTVRHDFVRRAMQYFDACDGNGIRPVAGDSGAHRAHTICQVHHFRFACGVLQHGHTVGQSRRHHQVLGTGDADDIEENACAFKTFGLGVNVAVFDGDLRPHRLQSFDVQIDGTRTDGATAGQRDPGLAEARHQRTQHKNGCTHGLDHVIWRFPNADFVAPERDLTCRGFRLNTHLLQQFAHGADIVQVGQIGQAQVICCQQAGAHDGQGGVFGAGDTHFTA